MTDNICTCNICTVIDLAKIAGFEWDRGNIDKSFQKHGITIREAEEAFLDKHVFLQEDIKHSEKEDRYIAISKTSKNKMLFTIFTVRDTKIRIISTRVASKKERGLYEEKIKANS